MNVFIDDNSATKINLFTNISHKPLQFLFVYFNKSQNILNLISSITSNKTLFLNILNNKKQ